MTPSQSGVGGDRSPASRLPMSAPNDFVLVGVTDGPGPMGQGSARTRSVMKHDIPLPYFSDKGIAPIVGAALPFRRRIEVDAEIFAVRYLEPKDFLGHMCPP